MIRTSASLVTLGAAVLASVTLALGTVTARQQNVAVDKDDLAVRRNEIDAVVGSRDTYISLGYLRLDRDISVLVEDLDDREEIRVGGRLAFARYWSVFGSAVVIAILLLPD